MKIFCILFITLVVIFDFIGSAQSNSRMKRSSGGLASFVNYQVSVLQASTPVLTCFCGGSVVSDYFVLTAAHCVDEPRVLIRAGSSYCLRGGSLHTPELILKHRDYMGRNNGFIHDIALIRVSEPLSGPSIAAIPLSGVETPPNSYGTVSGWGSIYESPKLIKKPFILQAAIIPIHSKEACKMYSEMYRDQYGIIHPERGQICAGNLTTTACHGDSGGPLVYNGFQVGVVSNGPTVCGTLPTFFTEVSQYIAWILTYVK